MPKKKMPWIATLGPGILVAATGVGAGDLATATFTGMNLGTAVLWAVVVGASLKYLLNEGLTRWQLATGTTLLEGCVRHLGKWVQWVFVVYLVPWSYLVGIALMSACGVAATAIFPVFDDAYTGKVAFGILHSLIAASLVWLGGYKLFERVMSLCIAVMFFVVVITAIALRPAWTEVAQGLLVPTIPDLRGEGLAWTLALLGGVGGTVTVLCYGYWIREEGRHGIDALPMCRIDLGVGYFMTALFGMSMIIVGSQITGLDGKGAGLIVNVADTLETSFRGLGLYARWAFLVGAWAAFFSSLLGVWQSVPYLFTDFWNLVASEGLGRRAEGYTRSFAYRAYLGGMTVLPITGLVFLDFQSAVKVYAVVGAFFIPMLAAVLLLLNGNRELVGEENRNSKWTSGLLVATLLVFLVAAGYKIVQTLGG